MNIAINPSGEVPVTSGRGNFAIDGGGSPEEMGRFSSGGYISAFRPCFICFADFAVAVFPFGLAWLRLRLAEAKKNPVG